MVEPVLGTASWVREGAPDEAFLALEAYARGRKVRTKKSANEMTIFLGNRLVYRLLGPSSGRVPYTIRVSASDGPDGSTRLTAQGQSDPGPFLFRLDSASRTYELLIADTLEDLQQL